MFFEPPPAEEMPAPRRRPRFAPWAMPSQFERGAVVPVELVVASNANVVIAVPTIRAFRSGCLFEVEVIARQGDLSPDDWWELQTSGLPVERARTGGRRLPDKLLRLGVRYADGRKATTVGQLMWFGSDSAEPPAGPVLSWQPRGGGGGHGIGGEYSFHDFGLWLWPLPPAEKIEFAVEWPFGGIGLTFVDLDGAAIAAAARRSQPYWADDGEA